MLCGDQQESYNTVLMMLSSFKLQILLSLVSISQLQILKWIQSFNSKETVLTILVNIFTKSVLETLLYLCTLALGMYH